MNRWWRVMAVLIAVTMVAVPALAQVTPQDISEAEAEMAELRTEAEQLATQLEAAVARSAQLETQVTDLEGAVQDSQVRLAATRRLVRERAVEMYIESSTSQLLLLFLEGTEGGFEVGMGYLEELGTSDTALLRDLQIIKAEYERQLAELEAARAEQSEVVADLDDLSGRLSARLETAQDRYVALVAQRVAEERARLEAEARRRAEEEAARRAAEEAARAATTTTTVAASTVTTVAAATTTTVVTNATEATTTSTTTEPPAPAAGRTCPVNGFTTFTDTWGAPRSGGRAHQGVDMLGARGTPLVAIESGKVLRMSTSSLGGITVWLRGDGGDTFYYAHMEAWAEVLQAGQSIGMGDLVGYLGSSGNASYSTPHLHFEYHPGGGGAVNPYPLVKGLCG